jgi:hypothetical protein
MQVRCVRARAGIGVGDLVEVPDGAEVSSLYFEVVEPPPPAGPGITQGPGLTPPLSSPVSSVPVKDGAAS